MKKEIKKVLFGTHGTGGVLFLIVFGIIVYAIIWDSFQPDYPIHIVDRDRVDTVERESIQIFDGSTVLRSWYLEGECCADSIDYPSNGGTGVDIRAYIGKKFVRDTI